MQNGIFVTGTDTDVGKTWVGQQLIKQLIKQGVDVVPRKPIESGWDTVIQNTDAWKLADAANKLEQLEQICPNHFEQAVSPVRAAQFEGQSIKLEQLQQQCLFDVSAKQFLHIEGAGGFYSPLASDALNADLAQVMALPLLIVAEDRVGCINHILLTVEAAQTRGLKIAAIYLNQKTIKTTTVMDNKKDLECYINEPICTDIKELSQIINGQIKQ